MKFLSLSIHHLSLLYPNYLLTSISSSYSYNYPLRLKRSLIFLNHSPRGSNHTFEREEREEKKRKLERNGQSLGALHLDADASRSVLTLLRWRVTSRINYHRENRESLKHL